MPQDGEGLNQDFSGAREEAVLRIKPWIVDDRWLLIAAPAGNSVAIVDLENPAEQIFIHDVKYAFASTALLRTSDGKYLIQLNTDGRFYVYTTVTTKK
jgi:hypothetical protein